ncbi:hypothetical protein [uncultured Caulobacter sp.]|uniref:hypothetical protein n=1 Tax=uncultured Caulobacter sp. TaxID=158749 RepID=UPI00260485F4|nr:hypothetical protein [uncultured Caulobacter sp.]
MVVGLGVAIAAAGAVVALKRPQGWSFETGFAVGLGAALAIGGAIKFKRSPLSETPAAGRLDTLQRQRSRQLVVLPALMLMLLGQAIGGLHALATGEARMVSYIQILMPVLYGWLIPAIVMGWDGQSRRHRRYLDDEFTRALRSQALTAAFLCLMAGTTAALGLGLWRPIFGVVALPLVLAISGAVAGLRFAWLEREAERG